MVATRNDNPDGACAEPTHAPVQGRPYIGVLFECCGVYTRIYRRPDQQFYFGRCPNCLRTVRVRVGEDGTNERLFRAW